MSSKVVLLHQFIVEVSGKGSNIPLSMLLSGSYTQDEAVKLCEEYIRVNHWLDKYAASTPVKCTLHSISSNLAMNKVIGSTDKLIDIFPKYLFQAKVRNTKVQEFRAPAQEKGNEKKNIKEAINDVVHGVAKTIL